MVAYGFMYEKVYEHFLLEAAWLGGHAEIWLDIFWTMKGVQQ